MFQTKEYSIKQESVPHSVKSSDNIYPIGIDIGYSAVKGFTPKSHFIFPSFTRELSGSLLTSDPNDILIKDLSNNETWIVGKNALDGISSDDTNVTGEEWYLRNRYASREFRILIMAALGMSDLKNKNVSDNVLIQTGLPPAYIEGDSRLIKRAFSGKFDFTIRVGHEINETYHFEVPEEHVFVMPQPMGTLYSTIMNADGSRASDWKSFFGENTIIFDGGFGTLDIYTIRGRQKYNTNSYNKLGMHEVMRRTSERILREYGEDVSIHQLLHVMDTGEIIVFDEDTISDEKKDITSILKECSDSVCRDAIAKLLSVCKPIKDYRHLIVTGGTGAAWFDMISEKFSKMSSLSVVKGNRNDNLDPVYSNVRGYYYFCADSNRNFKIKAKEG